MQSKNVSQCPIMAALITLLNTKQYAHVSIQTKDLLTALKPQRMPFLAVRTISVYLETELHWQGMAGNSIRLFMRLLM